MVRGRGRPSLEMGLHGRPEVHTQRPGPPSRPFSGELGARHHLGFGVRSWTETIRKQTGVLLREERPLPRGNTDPRGHPGFSRLK